MNKLARKLVLSVLTVVLTVIALGTTTFAWFTLTNTASIQAFNAQIISDSGIEIAIGDLDTANPITLDWKTSLTPQDIYNYLEEIYGVDGFRFNHVSTEDGLVFYTLGETAQTEINHGEGFIVLPIHFRSDTIANINWTNVELSSTEFTFNNTFVTYTDSKGVEIAQGSTTLMNAADAMRISILNAAKDNMIVAYENPVSDTNTELGAVGISLENANGAGSFYRAVTSVDPFGANAVTTVATITTLVSNAQQVLTMTSGNVATAGKDYYGMIHVVVWFEGWDAEAFNAMLEKVITISLTFQGVE